MKFVRVFLIIALLMIMASFFVLAERGGNDGSGNGGNRVGTNSDDDDDDSDDDSEEEIELESEIEDDDEKIKNKIKFKSKSDGEEVEIESENEIEIEENETGKSKVKVRDSNGNQREVKVMPDVASSIAIELLMSKNLTIELREVGSGSGKKIIYVSIADKNGMLLGLFKIKIKKEVEIDSETGEVIKIKKKWWAVFVAGEDDDELNEEKILVCHVPKGNPANKHTISISQSALKAHLAHGDNIGSCGGLPGQNQTNQTTPPQTNQTNQTIPPQINQTGLTLTINSPTNMTYNTSQILIDISSNGDVMTYSINNGVIENYSSSFLYNFSGVNNNLMAFAKNSSSNESMEKSVYFQVVIVSPNNGTI